MCDVKIDINPSRSEAQLAKVSTNSYYQGLVQNLYSGSESELDMFLQFHYQYVLISVTYPDIADIFKKIFENDRKHLELLAKAIVSLGGDPKYITNNGQWFSTRSVDYVKNIKQMICFNIELKEKSIIDYRLCISKISNEDLVMYLERILMDEENHLRILKGINETI